MQQMGYRGSRYYHEETEEKPHITKALVFRMLTYFSPYWKLMSGMVLTIIITSILGIIPAILTKNIIDIALPQKNINLLILYIVLSFFTLLALNLINVGQSYLNSLVSKNIIRDLRAEMYEHLQGMSLKFFSNVKTGEITSRINNDIGGIDSVFSNIFLQILSGIFVFTSTCIILFYTNWILAVISLLTLPFFLVPTRKVGKTRWKIASEAQAKLAELTNIITETLNVNGTMLIKLFTKEKEENNAFEKVNNEVMKLQIRETVVGRWFFMTIQTFVSIGPVLIYLFGGLLLIKYNNITIGGIVMFVTLVSRLYGPINTFLNIHVDIVNSMAIFERIFQYLDFKSEIIEKPDSVSVDNVAGSIRFDHGYLPFQHHHP